MSIPETCNDCGYCLPDNSNTTHVCNHPDGDTFLIYPNETKINCPILDDELDAIRTVVMYRGESLYIIITLKDNKPYEVFATFAVNGVPNLYYMVSSIDAITRLTSMQLKTGNIIKVIRQLKKSSITKKDFPGILSTLLEKCNG